jgi:argininosuccinate synthase
MTQQTATEPRDDHIGFERGVPVSLDGERLALHGRSSPAERSGRLLRVGPHRHGREPPRRHQEPRDLRGPAALALIMAHRGSGVDLSGARPGTREGPLEPRYAELVYDGLWFSPLKKSFDAFIDASQEFVTGEVRLRLEPNSC